jgi:hypothetical protein
MYIYLIYILQIDGTAHSQWDNPQTHGFISDTLVVEISHEKTPTKSRSPLQSRPSPPTIKSPPNNKHLPGRIFFNEGQDSDSSSDSDENEKDDYVGYNVDILKGSGFGPKKSSILTEVYIYMCIYVCTYIYINTHICINTYIKMYLYAQTKMLVYTFKQDEYSDRDHVMRKVKSKVRLFFLFFMS